MALVISSLKRDHKRQDDGDWVPIPEWIDPETGEVPEFHVRGITYTHFQNALSILNAKNTQRGGQNAPVEVRRAHREFGRIVAQHLLLDWRGIKEPYSRELAEDLCCNYESPVTNIVTRCANEIAEVKMEYDSAAAKNSERSSDGNSQAAA
jgi:hypothetical protein